MRLAFVNKHKHTTSTQTDNKRSLSNHLPKQPRMRVRTVTVLVSGVDGRGDVRRVLGKARQLLDVCEEKLKMASFEVQTARVAMSDPAEWLAHWPKQEAPDAPQAKKDKQAPSASVSGGDHKHSRDHGQHTQEPAKGLPPKLREELEALDQALQEHGISFFNLGCLRSASVEEVAMVPDVLLLSPRFNMSVNVSPGDLELATALAHAVQRVACESKGGLGNFRLCASACCGQALIPFFPAGCAPTTAAAATEATAAGGVRFSVAVGLENGDLTNQAAEQARVSAKLHEALRSVMLAPLQQIEAACEDAVRAFGAASGGNLLSVSFAGVDTSFNPSLDQGMGGSVAHGLNRLADVASLSDLGALGAVARATTGIQALPVKQTGYRGLMLPVCEDRFLAALGTAQQQQQQQLTIQHLLILSSVCGVGVDTVPIPGAFDVHRLALLYLDMSGLAHRWNKPLSCRVFPVPGKEAGDMTTFDSPYLVNTSVFSL